MQNLEEQLHSAEIDVEFQDKTEEELFQLVMLGEEARDFFGSATGRYVIGAAKQDLDDIDEKLRRVRPWRSRKINRLQMKRRAVRDGIRWIAETIQHAVEAERQLQQYRES